MAAITMYTAFKESPRPDDLCPKCLNPALKLYTLQKVDLDGITVIGTRVACRDCRIWIGPLKETK